MLITFTDAEVSNARDFAILKARYKQKEGTKDNHGLATRSFKGVLGEMAVEKAFNVRFIDWSVGVNSRDYDKPDAGRIGVKTHDKGCEALIPKSNKYPQVICCYIDDHHVEVEGIATVEVLNECQDDSLVRNPFILLKRKTAFTGMDRLEDPKNFFNFFQKST